MAVGQLTHITADATGTVKSASVLAIPNDGSVVVGDLLIWCITYDSGSVVRSNLTTGVSGFTQLPDVVNTGHRSSVWYKVAELSDLGASITVTSLENGSSAVIRRVAALGKISGVDPANPLGNPDKYASSYEANALDPTKDAPPVASIGSDCREIHIVFDNQNNAGHTTNWTAPTGFTRRGQANNPGTEPQDCSFAWGDSDTLVSGSASGGTWTADDAALGAAWTLVAHPEVSASALEELVEDTEGLTDTVGFVSAQVGSVNDAEGVTDALALVSAQTDTFGESLGLTDSLSLVLSVVGTETVGDTLGLTDSVSLDLRSPRPVSYGDTLVMGPARIFIGDFEATEPEGLDILNDPAMEDWTDVGATSGGLQITVEQEYKVIEVRQIAEAPARRLERRKVTARTELAEPTLQNLLYVLNSGTMASGTGFTSYSAPPEVNEATPLDYRAVLIYGWAPGVVSTGAQKRRVVILRKCISSEGTTLKYDKENQTNLSAQWSVHYVDSSTPSFRIIDET